MAYYVTNLDSESQKTKDCGCKNKSQEPKSCGIPVTKEQEYFKKSNLLNELVSEYQRTMARMNLGVKDFEDFEVYKNSLDQPVIKVTWNDGYDKISKEFALDLPKAKDIINILLQDDILKQYLITSVLNEVKDKYVSKDELNNILNNYVSI